MIIVIAFAILVVAVVLGFTNSVACKIVSTGLAGITVGIVITMLLINMGFH